MAPDERRAGSFSPRCADPGLPWRSYRWSLRLTRRQSDRRSDNPSGLPTGSSPPWRRTHRSSVPGAAAAGAASTRGVARRGENLPAHPVQPRSFFERGPAGRGRGRYRRGSYRRGSGFDILTILSRFVRSAVSGTFPQQPFRTIGLRAGECQGAGRQAPRQCDLAHSSAP